MNPSEAKQHKTETSWILKRLYLLTGSICVMIIGMVGFSFHYGVEMNTVYAPQIDASLEIELKATAAHMFVEEILAGDTTKEVEDVWKQLDKADWYVQALLKGGENREGRFLPLKGRELRSLTENLKDRLAEFRKIAQHRLSKREISGTGTDVDRHYDQVYSVFIREADEVRHRLQGKMKNDLIWFQGIQSTLMGICFLLLVILGVAFVRFERFRDRNFKILQETNEKLQNEIQERKRAEEQLIHTGEQLRKLSNKLQYIREQEKTRIAREVHDELGQTLSALKMELVCMNNEIGKDSPTLKERSQVMAEIIDSAITSVQRIATELRPQILDVLGLCDAIAWQTHEFQERTGIRCHLSLSKEKTPLEPDLSTTLFRVFQETLTNVFRHAHASEVNIQFHETNNNLLYEITDNGVGIPAGCEDSAQSLGLLGIRERVLAWGGQTRIESAPNQGTRVSVVIPRNHKPMQVQAS